MSTTTAQQPLLLSKPKKKRAHWPEAVAGACAGAMSRTLMAPVERVKLLLQLPGEAVGGGKNSNSSSKTNMNSWRIAQSVYQEQGLLSFWRGNTPNVVRVAGTAAVNFYALTYYKELLHSRLPSKHHYDRRSRHVWISFLAGGLAGATSTTLLYPVEFVRTRLAMDISKKKNTPTTANQVNRLYYTGSMDVVKRILASDGVLGLYSGYGIALVGGVVYRVLYLGGYDALKHEAVYWKQHHPTEGSTSSHHHLTFTERFFLAQAISLTAGTATYPLDTVRRRLMMQSGKMSGQRLYTGGTFDCFATIWRDEGIKGFYRGIGPNLVRSLGNALLLVGYDAVSGILKVKLQHA